MSRGYMYILRCNDKSYYTGSTKDLELRLLQHQQGFGANYTKKRLPVELVYFEEYERIDEAFLREKQIKGWRRAKKELLINGESEKLSNSTTELKSNTEPYSVTEPVEVPNKLASPYPPLVTEPYSVTELAEVPSSCSSLHTPLVTEPVEVARSCSSPHSSSVTELAEVARSCSSPHASTSSATGGMRSAIGEGEKESIDE